MSKTEFNKMLDEERYHMENLVNNRFNFLLLIFSLTIVSITAAENKIILFFIFFISLILCSALTLTIMRAHKKFRILSLETNKLFSHPAKIADLRSKKEGCILTRCSYKNFIGYYIPIGLVIILLLSNIFIASLLNDKIYKSVFSSKYSIKTPDINTTNDFLKIKNELDDIDLLLTDLTSDNYDLNKKINNIEKKLDILLNNINEKIK